MEMYCRVLTYTCKSVFSRTRPPLFSLNHERIHFLVTSNSLKAPLSYSSKVLSLASRPVTGESKAVFRTVEDDPRLHTSDHIGLYYRVPEDEMKILLKDGLHPWHQRLMTSFNESCLMVRQQALELRDYINNLNYNYPVPRFVLYGKTGSGKMTTMSQIMQCCYRNDWIVVHVPLAGRWLRGARGVTKEVSESTYKNGRYDVPMDAAEWLTYFKHINQGKLKDWKTTSEYVWTKREKADVGTPLDEIIEFGLSRIKFSADCVGVLLKELRLQAHEKQQKVLVAINAVNAFFTPWHSNYYALQNIEKRKLHPGELSHVHNFKKMMSPSWKNGAVVCTVQEAVNDPELRENYTPHYLMGQEGFEALDPFVPILVPEYTEKEALSTINYYIDRNWIQNEYGKTEEGKKEIMFVSNKNPFTLMTVCGSL